jgi:RecA-family ATPase
MLAKFSAAMFKHTGAEGYVSLRAFYEDDAAKPFRITPVSMKGGLPFLIEAVEDDAYRAANHPRKVVFCPPIAIFSGEDRAREGDILEGPALSVECDQRPREARATLEEILGPATLVVRSGGAWTDPDNGQVYDKLHLHWRLSLPARGAELAKLKAARDLAARLCGGDPSNKPVCHPIRWPGSWHRKGDPRLCEIETATEHEIDLGAALAALEKASPAPNKTNGGNAIATATVAPATDWAELVSGIITGSNYHGAEIRLASKMITAGMADGAVVNMLRGIFESAREKYGTRGEQAADQPLVWLDMSNWDNEPRPEREWAIRDRVPLKQVGLFSGEGGTGKSIIEMMKDVGHVAARDWLGSMPEPGSAFYVGAEDDQNEIHIRFHDIAAHYGVTFKQLIEGGLHVLPLLGQDATLCAVSGKSGRVEVTAIYRRLFEAAGDIKPINISIDTLSRAFAGSELDRVQVYAFAMHMQAMAMAAGGSVTVLSHPSLTGISSGSGISGSTAWHGAFRFRQYLTSVRPEDNEQPDNNLRQFEFKKNQYGPIGEAITLRYQRGLFLPLGGLSSLDKLAREAIVDDVFLATAKKLEGRGQELSPAQTSHSYGPTIIARQSEAKAIKKAELVAALDRLLEQGRLRIETLNPGTTREKKVIRACGSSQ